MASEADKVLAHIASTLRKAKKPEGMGPSWLETTRNVELALKIMGQALPRSSSPWSTSKKEASQA
eukprot:4424984-Prorocentrum_lima.AAC.1